MAERADVGAYLLLLKLSCDKRIRIGELGRIRFLRGHYVYVGSAMRGISSRVAWHRRADKRPRWHVDYLRRRCDRLRAFRIPSARSQECEIAAALGRILEQGPPGFGSSDCHCLTHLFRSAHSPLRLRPLRDLLGRLGAREAQ